MEEQNWEKVGEWFKDMVERGYYPGIGYDETGWEAWVFIDPPVEGELGERIKSEANTLNEAIENVSNDVNWTEAEHG